MIIRSCQHYNQYQITPDSPMASLPQVAIVGRSNSGKSTLLNAIVGQRQMARTSRRPGRTQEIHYFLINNRMWLVDLPGYGYAKVSKAMRREWSQRMVAYFEGLASSQGLSALKFVLLIQDVRRDPGPDEQWLLDWFSKLANQSRTSRAATARLVLEAGDRLGLPGEQGGSDQEVRDQAPPASALRHVQDDGLPPPSRGNLRKGAQRPGADHREVDALDRSGRGRRVFADVTRARTGDVMSYQSPNAAPWHGPLAPLRYEQLAEPAKRCSFSVSTTWLTARRASSYAGSSVLPFLTAPAAHATALIWSCEVLGLMRARETKTGGRVEVVMSGALNVKISLPSPIASGWAPSYVRASLITRRT